METSNGETTQVSLDPEVDIDYRTLSKAAVGSVALGLLSLFSFVFSSVTVFALLGIGLAIYALITVWKYPDEYSGKGVARFGLGLCSLVFVSATALHTYIYLTEVPPDHVRLTFGDIKAPKYQRLQPTEKALELNGKRVFIKGYTFPGKQKKNLSQFLLVGDFGQCCFGGNPEPSHLIRVSIKNGRKIDYSQRLRKLAGTFRVLPQVGVNGEGQGYLYELEAEEIK